MPKKKQQKQAPPTVITVTLPEEDGIQRSGTLLIQRGELAHVRQFSYTNLGEIAAVLKDAVVALSSVEADPPDISKANGKSSKASKNDAKAADTPPEDEEPTIDVPTKKGTVAVKMSHLKIVAGETDAAAYRQATLAAGRFIDGGSLGRQDSHPVRGRARRTGQAQESGRQRPEPVHAGRLREARRGGRFTDLR